MVNVAHYTNSTLCNISYIHTRVYVCILLYKTVPGHSITIICNIHCFLSQSIRTLCNGKDSHPSEIKCDPKKAQIQNQHDQIFHASCEPTEFQQVHLHITLV